MDKTLQKYKKKIEESLESEVISISWSNEHFDAIDVIVKPVPPIKNITIRLCVEETKLV